MLALKIYLEAYVLTIASHRYTSVRIDAVHYCYLEEELADKRKKGRHFRGKSNVPTAGEIPIIRLGLFCRTVRENSALASQVLFLKVPYMTRETAKGDLARTVSALPNLRHVDLPDGFFTDDPSCIPLRQELQSRCPDIRKMMYRSGSEDALELLVHRHWQSLEYLELSNLAIEPATLRIVLGSLPSLTELVLKGLEWMDDTIFHVAQNNTLPEFPALQSLTIEECPNLTAAGLAHYLESPYCRETLYSLTLKNTGVAVPDLHTFLFEASSLHHLAIIATVSKSITLQTQDLPPMTSISIKTLNFEIDSSEDAHGLQKPAESYYAYLATSLHANALPALTTVYVRDQAFTDLLLLPPLPALPQGSPGSGSQKSRMSHMANGHTSVRGVFGPAMTNNSTFNQTLEVFSKGIDELEWVMTSITPPSRTGDRRGSASGARPISMMSASRGLGPQWAQGGFGGEARRSVMVGNGFGGFLAVPQDEVPRPRTSDGGSRFGSFSSADHNSEASGGSWFKPPPSIGSLAGEGPKAHKRKTSRHDLFR